jgi:hypothetical protein
MNPESMRGRIKSLSAFHYSAIIAIENNTHILIGKKRVRVEIPLNSMFFLEAIYFTLEMPTHRKI